MGQKVNGRGSRTIESMRAKAREYQGAGDSQTFQHSRRMRTEKRPLSWKITCDRPWRK